MHATADVHNLQESVRKAADIACNSLHKVTVRACDGASMDKTGTLRDS